MLIAATSFVSLAPLLLLHPLAVGQMRPQSPTSSVGHSHRNASNAGIVKNARLQGLYASRFAGWR